MVSKDQKLSPMVNGQTRSEHLIRAMAVRTCHAIEPNSIILHAPSGRAKVTSVGTAFLCLCNMGGKAIPLTEEVGNMDVRERFNRTDALGSKHVRLHASFPPMFSTGSCVEYVPNSEVGEGVVEACLRELGGVTVDGDKSPRIGDGDVVRSDADNGSCNIVLRPRLRNDSVCEALPYCL